MVNHVLPINEKKEREREVELVTRVMRIFDDDNLQAELYAL